jgi:uncharacterized protein YdaU (DUF1376 family)
MPLYVGDYLGDTGHLTTTQHGAYLLLMMHYWRKGSLPDEDKQLAAITKLSLKGWLECRETMQMFFYDGWSHKRIDAELQTISKLSNKRAIAGQLGGMRSALSRMNMENAALGKSSLNSHRATTHKTALLNSEQPKSLIDNEAPQAIAKQTSTIAAARVEYSHSQSKKEEGKEDGSLATAHLEGALREPREERKQEASSKPVAKPSLVASPELVASLQRRMQ